MELLRRCVLALLPLVLLSIEYKSHEKASSEASVAFFRFTGFSAPVRIKGDLVQPGIYKFPDGERLLTAIKMTVPKVFCFHADNNEAPLRISSGDVIQIRCQDGKCLDITVTKMPVKERILLGIPLNPNELQISEWQLLPGIGPRTARNIVEGRQLNGGFSTLQDLVRVPGIGEGTVRSLISYF